MSFFDTVKSEIGGQMDGQSTDMASTVLSKFGGNKAESLINLAKAFHQGGVGGAVNSWISSGENQQITADQVTRVLGHDRVAEVASKFGMTPEQASGKLAEVLPAVVDRLTPAGKLPGH